MIYYSIWSNQGTLSFSLYPDPQKVIGIIEVASFKAWNFMIFDKNSRGGREGNMINTLSKLNLSKIGWEGGRSTPIWIMSLNRLCFFWRSPLSNKFYPCAPIVRLVIFIKNITLKVFMYLMKFLLSKLSILDLMIIISLFLISMQFFSPLLE